MIPVIFQSPQHHNWKLPLKPGMGINLGIIPPQEGVSIQLFNAGGVLQIIVGPGKDCETTTQFLDRTYAEARALGWDGKGQALDWMILHRSQAMREEAAA